jgi:hypothetical protein
MSRVLRLNIEIEIPFDDLFARGTETVLIEAIKLATPRLTETINRVLDDEQARISNRQLELKMPAKRGGRNGRH